MKKIYSGVFVSIFLVLGGVFYFLKENDVVQISHSDYKNTSFIIEGEIIALQNGYAETHSFDGSVATTVTRYFGNEVFHDLNDDGREDVVFLVTQETGGTGVFIYVVAALNTPDGYIGSHAFFLGDRIAPQSTIIDEGETSLGTNRKNVVVVNYATRLPGEPFTAEPSLGTSVWLKLDPITMQFGEVEKDFGGEAR